MCAARSARFFRPPPTRIGSWQPPPKRWIVERTFGWLNRARRLAKDFEELVVSSQAWLMLALAALLVRRIARNCTQVA